MTKQGVDDFIFGGGDVSQLLADAVPLGQFVADRPRPTEPESDDDAAYWKDRALAAEARHRTFMHAMRCKNASFRKVVPTLAAIHLAYDSAVSRDENANPRLARALGPDGSLRITRRTLAEIAGRNEDTITSDLKLLEEHGCLSRGVTRLFPGDVDPDTDEIVDKPRSIMRIMPLRSAVADFRYAQSVPKPDAEKQETGWGGPRTCEACGSKRLEVVCLDCGHHQPLATPAPKKPIHTVKRQLAVSGKEPVGAVDNPPTLPPHSTKNGNLPFHDADRDIERRAALRNAQPVARYHREPTSVPPIPLGDRIVAVVTAATAKKQPLHEDEVARAVGAQKRDVRTELQSLVGQQRVKRWRDGMVTAVPVSIGAD